METTRATGWTRAARATLILAIFVTAIECSTFLGRFSPESPEWLSDLFAFLGVVYFLTVLVGVPLTIVAALVVGFKRGKPRKLGLISGSLILAGFAVACLALSVP